MGGTGQGAPVAESASASGDDSGSGSSDEDYDEYDINEDGIVSSDELIQVFQSGDSSLKTVFDSMDAGVMSKTQTRLAMNAYQQQMV